MIHPATSTKKTSAPDLAFKLLTAFFFLVLLRFLTTNAYHAAVAPGSYSGGDYAFYHAAATRLVNHQPLYVIESRVDIYQGLPYCYPPLLALLLKPLASLSQEQAFKVWSLFSTFCLAGSAFLFCWAARLRPWVFPVAAGTVFITAFRFWPTTLQLMVGNVDCLLLMLVCGMFVCARYQNYLLLGFIIAFCALLKTWMIAPVAYLVLCRQWRAAAATVFVFLIGLALLFTIVGWREFPVFVEMTRLFSNSAHLVSQSFPGFCRMYLSENTIIDPLVNSPLLSLGILVGLYAALSASFFYVWRLDLGKTRYERRLQLSFVLICMLLALPQCHIYYYVLALPVLWTLLTSSPRFSRDSLFILGGAIFAYLILSLPSPGLSPVSEAYRSGLRSLKVVITLAAGTWLWIVTFRAIVVAVRDRSLMAHD